MPRRFRPPLLALLGALFLTLPAVAAFAAPEEIEVYRDEVTPLHRWGLEVNQSFVPAGPVEQDGPINQIGLYRLTPELNYGFAPHWEGGVLAETTIRDGAFDAHGIKAHVRWIAPKPESQPWYLGFNAEVGWTDRHLEERPWSMELRAIAGWESERWVLSVNPTIETAVSAHGGEPVQFELQSKLGYKVGGKWMVGLESYNAFGPLAQLDPLSRESQELYLAADTEWRGADVNLGVGRGLTHASDGWVIKAVIGVPLGR